MDRALKVVLGLLLFAAVALIVAAWVSGNPV
jgi:hypothetical protein